MSLHLYAMELSFIGYCKASCGVLDYKAFLKFHKYTPGVYRLNFKNIIIVTWYTAMYSLYVPVEEFTDQPSS